MCTASGPNITQQTETKKPVEYLSNPWVDGLGINGATTRGRNSLRVDQGSARVPVTADLNPTNPAPTPPPQFQQYFGGAAQPPGMGLWGAVGNAAVAEAMRKRQQGLGISSGGY